MGWMILLLFCAGCSREPVPAIELLLGSGQGSRQSFVPQSAFAEYTELPDSGDELVITLANFDISCDQLVPVPTSGTLVALAVVMPKGRHPERGTFAWAGHAAHGGTPTEPSVPYVVPQVNLANRSVALPPGGGLQLTEVELERHGLVRGILQFEQSGGPGVPASRLLGSFRARVCRASPAAPVPGR